MNFCYIIYSKKLNRFYTGICQDDLEVRIRKHNDHTYGTHRFTAAANDWILFLAIECSSYAMARNIEIHIKKMKSSTYIKNLQKYPELLNKLKTKYQG